MAKRMIPVTRAQVKAAQIAVERSAKSGRVLRPGTEQLAASDQSLPTTSMKTARNG